MIIKNHTPSKARQKSKSSKGGFGLISVVKSGSNGKRIEFRNDIAESIGIVDRVSVLYNETSIVFFVPNLEDDITQFNVRTSGKKYVVYSSQLVEEIAEFLELNFDTTVCHTLCKGSIDTIEELDAKCLVILKEIETTELKGEKVTC